MIISELRANAWKLASAVLTVLAVAALLSALYFRGSAALSNASAKAAQQEADYQRSRADAVEGVLIKERAKNEAMAEIATQYEVEKREIETAAERTISDLRAGHLRLRQLWEAKAATADLSAAVTSASQPDDGAAGRKESAGRIVRAAAECDAQIRGLQEVIKEDRR